MILETFVSKSYLIQNFHKVPYSIKPWRFSPITIVLLILSSSFVEVWIIITRKSSLRHDSKTGKDTNSIFLSLSGFSLYLFSVRSPFSLSTSTSQSGSGAWGVMQGREMLQQWEVFVLHPEVPCGHALREGGSAEKEEEPTPLARREWPSLLLTPMAVEQTLPFAIPHLALQPSRTAPPRLCSWGGQFPPSSLLLLLLLSLSLSLSPCLFVCLFCSSWGFVAWWPCWRIFSWSLVRWLRGTRRERWTFRPRGSECCELVLFSCERVRSDPPHRFSFRNWPWLDVNAWILYPRILGLGPTRSRIVSCWLLLD